MSASREPGRNDDPADAGSPLDSAGGAEAAADSDETALERIADRLVSAGAAAGRLFASARELGEGEAARLRRAGRSPLPNLYDLHPEARFAARRPLGLMTVPVTAVRGSAVDGPAQRGGDFLPLPRLRSRNWKGRWQRLQKAQENLAVLPPIDLLQAGDGYWVTDGHNRVAAALYGGQDEIDANVTHVHLPGERAPEPRGGSLAAGLEGADDLRAAGEGRLTRGSSLRRGGARRRRDR